MKRNMMGWLVVCVAWVFGMAPAQGVGLPIMDTADSREQGNLEVTPGGWIGEDLSYYGARVSATALEEMRVFLDLGILSVKDAEDGFGGQVGALYSLPSDSVTALGLRGACYFADTEELDVLGGNLMLVFSDETLLDDLFLYGGAGADYGRKEGWYGKARSELNPIVALGLEYLLHANVSIFAEVTHTDTSFIGGGIRIR
jgi:hypothetical protein